MGNFFARLFGGSSGGKPEAQAAALRRYFDEKLPKNYTASPQYDVSITPAPDLPAARITLDMCSDGSDYAGFGEEDYANISELESSYVFETFLTDPPCPVSVTFDMVFDHGRRIAVNRGRTPRNKTV